MFGLFSQRNKTCLVETKKVRLARARFRVVGLAIAEVVEGPVSRLPAAGESVVADRAVAVSGAAGAGAAATATNFGPRA